MPWIRPLRVAAWPSALTWVASSPASCSYRSSNTVPSRSGSRSGVVSFANACYSPRRSPGAPVIESGVYKQKPGTSDGEHHAIARTPTGITAFVGRTLKGPVNRPLVIRSVADFHQIFGGLWQPSTLSYAIEHFFENGGRKAIVVRVVNGARPPTLTLSADRGPLRLIGVNPGSREYLRASVDYDGIVESEPDRFNLVLQRVRSP